jgi:hypothetical protein
MSEALVPGCMRRLELASRSVCSICDVSGVAAGPPDGEFGVIWISAAGGGLGNRGEAGASDMVNGGASTMTCDDDVVMRNWAAGG